ncbi:MAG: phage antirepressor protein [Desulfamplus sp.]|nr:phage antirepressor protein [Desulfamplus sp.]
MMFEGNEVEIIDLNGVVLFNPYHIGRCLDMAESTVRDHMPTMNSKQIIKVTNSIVGLTDIRKFNNAGENFLTESGVYRLILKSRKPEAEKFQNWVTDVVLPSIRKTGSYSIGLAPMQSPTIQKFDEAKAELGLELFVQEYLKTSEVSKLAVIHEVYKDYGITTKRLPQYTENVQVTKSATDLLAQFGYDMSAKSFNILMMAKGFLEEQTRTSTKKGIAKFKSLTKAGLEFGQNDANVNNKRETQPHYFVDKFEELYAILTKS